MNIESTIALPTPIDKVVVQREIELKESDLIATHTIIAIWEKAVEMDREIKTQTRALDDLKNKIKLYMNEAQVLLNPNGEELVTWKQAASRMHLNTEALKKEFNDVYITCCEEVPGTRPFCLK